MSDLDIDKLLGLQNPESITSPGVDDTVETENWNGLSNLMNKKPLDAGFNDPRLTLSTFDLDQIHDSDLFGVDGNSRFSLYIKNLSPPKGSNTFQVL